MPNGKLIILNGEFNPGETSLGRAMQDLLPDGYTLPGVIRRAEAGLTTTAEEFAGWSPSAFLVQRALWLHQLPLLVSRGL